MSQSPPTEVNLGRPAPPSVRSAVSGRLKRSDLEPVYRPVGEALAQVEQILARALVSDTPWVDRLLQHEWIQGGKRIRPLFLLLSGACYGPLRESHFQLAVAVEMVHIATLVHDDVLDKAETRRHHPTVNSQWDNRMSVLLGDYLFTRAFFVASSAGAAGAAEVVAMLAHSSNKVCEGEIRQNAWQGDFSITEQDYLAMIADKTAELCECSCRMGACLSGATKEDVQQFGRYGRNLGIAFQIIDDILDLVGSQEQVGKTLGTDLTNQKMTLPLIHCLEHLSDVGHESLLAHLRSGEATPDQVIPYLEQTGSIQYARTVARDRVQEALAFAKQLPAGPYSKSLQWLADFVLERTY